MFLRLRESSLTILLIILLLQLVFSPLLISLDIAGIGKKTESIVSEKGLLSSPNEPFFVSQKQAQPHQYPALARELARTSETPPEAVQPIVAADLKQSIQKELDTAKQSGAALLRRLEYENWLKAQVREIDPSPSFKEKVAATINSGLVGVGSVFSSKADTAGPAPAESILIPEKPSTFKFNDTDVNVHTLTPPHTSRIQANPKTLTGIFKQAKQAFVDLWRASPAIAQDQTNLPGLADVGADVGEVIIDSNIESLAAELNYNPVAITSYVRSRITYEPYFGGQKGSSGCLAQLLCNDVDTASLTIALLRASGIPARYKHSFVLVPVNQLKTMLGTDQVKTVYAALTNAGLSPKLVNTSIPVGTHIDDVDIESETQLALEWTWVEGYVEYDERGGNISFAADKDVVAGFVDDAGLRTYLAAFPKKQWLPIEPLLNRTITRTRNPIAVDSSSIDAKQFWLDYFQYQGTPGPITKFHDDVLGATGLDSSNPAYSSTVALTPNKNTYDILPPALPYGLVTSSDNNAGTTIITAPYSAWPDAWRQTVAVSLASQDGSQTFLDKTFFASEINNQSIYLRYNGATQTDADVIASYGGLASTPAPLVEIVPYLEFAGQLQSGATPVRIGDTLVLETKLTANGAIIHESQKFSIAGNEEGMFIAFSSVAADAYLDNVNESGLLAQGTAALARTYLRHLTANRDALSSALDYAANFQFMRAIVTQNRSLNVFGDYPATFDFSGLTMDAATDMNDYSRRDNYKNRRDYFRLLFGLEASRYEGQLFTDVAGLDGISTVSGLQYAYAHPETYTVHTIESANQSEIDGLNISSNVKAQIQAAVSAGATAVVPDKNITKGNFQGILYALLNADGTGQYAIGEQVANGGWTTDTPQQHDYVDENSQTVTGWVVDVAHAAEPENFYQEDRIVDGVMCRITEARESSIRLRPDWSGAYGFPCNTGVVHFGDVVHSFIQASNASQFESDNNPYGGYAYWEYHNDITGGINTYINQKKSLAANDIQYLSGGQRFQPMRFSVALGTYLQPICETNPGIFGLLKKCTQESVAYYSPSSAGGEIYRIKDPFLEKVAKNDNQIIKLLGFPKSDIGNAQDSINIKNGKFQNFVNGQLYALTPWVREMIYYTYGEIEKKHNAFGGTNGSFGYPIQNPKVVDGAVHQEFDSHQTLWWNTQDSSVAIYDSEALQCQLYEGGSSSIIGNARAGARGLADALTRVGEGIRGLSYLYVDIVTQEDDTVAALQEAVWNINLERLVNAIGAAFVGDAQEAYTDYTAARNDPNGCSYRTWYVGGIALGVAVDYLFPSKKLQTATKLKLAERLPGLLKYIDNISPGRLKSVGRIGNNGFVHRLTRQADIDEWNRIKAITDSNKKGSDGELFMHGMLGEGLEIQQPFPTSLGVRNADLFDPKPGKNLAHEVKFRQEISYSGSVKNQIEKEIELMNNLGPGNYQPIWHFLEAGPTEGLRKAMEDNGILYVIYTQ